MTFEEALQIFQSKGPVCLCPPGEGCKTGAEHPDMCGPQKQALKARRVLEEQVEIPTLVLQGQWRALAGFGHKRWEFDDPMAEWLETFRTEGL